MQAISNILLSFKFKKLNLLSILDNVLKNIFLPKTLNHYKKINKPYGIIINNNMLKFHNGDIREKVQKELVKSI